MIQKPGWAIVTGATWVRAQFADGHFGDADSVIGFVRALDEKSLGVSLVRDSRWALGFYLDEKATEPFFIMPGCQVRSIQPLTKPTTPGFLEWVRIKEAEGEWKQQPV